MRTFLCIPIERTVRDDIASISQELRVHVDARTSWVQPENYHVTLRFLGEIDPMLTVDLKQACQEVTEQIPAFGVQVNRIGAFPNLGSPRVLWVGGKAPEPFGKLLSLLDSSLSALGFEHARIEPLAHITVARVKGRLHKPLSEVIHQITQPTATLHADRLVLMESRLTPHGAIYTPLFTLRLAGGMTQDAV